jgi:PAS domain-containing protein
MWMIDFLTMPISRVASLPQLITIPSSDRTFLKHVRRLQEERPSTAPSDLEVRLRRLFPRVVVRERSLSGEAPAWYVYRDGGWRSPRIGPWWQDDSLPKVVATSDGWISSANPTAAGLLGIDVDDAHPHHFTDFVVPGTLQEAIDLFRIIEQGDPLTATVLLRPVSGQILAVELHAEREGSAVVGVLRLAHDIDLDVQTPERSPSATVICLPKTDGAFRGYVNVALARMPEPTPDGLALRLRRLYPHADVEVADDRWIAHRDREPSSGDGAPWWRDATLPRVRYDAQALIVEANRAAEALFGRSLVGHHWQEFVTAGSTEQVSVMLEILAAEGAAESRFRMPRGDGSLVEFDSYTEVRGEVQNGLSPGRRRPMGVWLRAG